MLSRTQRDVMRNPLRRCIPCVIVMAAHLPAASTQTDGAFESIARAFIEDYLRVSPEEATQLGDHRYDDRVTDYSPAGVGAKMEMLKKYRADLGRLEQRGLTGANRIDFRILALEIDAMLFRLTEERPHEWNPLSYNESLANGVYAFVAREFAPAEQRLRSAGRRLAAIPRVIEQIKANLKTPPRVHTETAIQQTAGAINLVRSGLDPLITEVP